MDTKTLESIKAYANEKYSRVKGQHGLHHVERVSKNGLLIAGLLGDRYKLDKNLIEAICYLHDVVMIKKKPNLLLSFYNHFFERSLNKKHLYDQIKCLKLTENESEILTNAIINHPYSIPYHHLNKKNDIYSKILQDADSLDYISKERVSSFINTYKFISPLVKFYISFIKKNFGRFLNFPELSKKLSLFEN